MTSSFFVNYNYKETKNVIKTNKHSSKDLD